MATDINRTTTITLPGEVSSEILQKTQESSAVMALARSIKLPGLGVTIPVITGDPEAAWVGETDKKPVKRGTLATKVMQPYTLAVIVPFSNQFRRDVPALYDELVKRLPLALAQKFDATVFGGVTVPGSNFDTLKGCTAQEIGTNAYQGLVAADADISDHNGILNGWVLSPKGKAALLNAVDMSVDAIDHVYVAGGIGSGINMKNAVNIGMFPDVELEKFHYIGNSSLSGAYAMVMSDEAAAKTAEVAANMTYLELSTYPGYMDSFVAACFLPHTDSSLFPTVMGQL